MLAQNLPAVGWDPWILAASTELATGKQRLGRGERVRFEDKDGVHFVWLRVPEYVGDGAGRVRNMVSYTLHASSRRLTRGLPAPDAVIGSSVHPLAGVAAQRLARRYRVPFVFEVRDLWPETLIAFGRIPRNGMVAVAMRKLERHLYRRARLIVTTLPRASDYVGSLGIDTGKVVWIPNGVDPGRFDPSWRTAGHVFTFMYLGAHGRANSLSTLIEAMALIQKGQHRERVRLRLVGAGPEKEFLKARARELGLVNVFFEPPVAASEVPAVASEADGFVICARSLPGLYRFGVSMNKLFDYMAASRPVVAALEAANNPVAESGCGVTVPPEDPHALADALVRVATFPPEKRRAMGARGRRNVETHYDYRVLAGRLTRSLDDLLEGHVQAFR